MERRTGGMGERRKGEIEERGKEGEEERRKEGPAVLGDLGAGPGKLGSSELSGVTAWG